MNVLRFPQLHLKILKKLALINPKLKKNYYIQYKKIVKAAKKMDNSYLL